MTEMTEVLPIAYGKRPDHSKKVHNEIWLPKGSHISLTASKKMPPKG